MPINKSNGALANGAPRYAILDNKTANGETMYGNVTASAFVTNQIAGVLAVDAAEIAVTSDKVLRIVIDRGGLGYVNSAALIFTGDADTNAAATLSTNSTGGITSITISNNGIGYDSVPTVEATTRISTTIEIDDGGSGYDSTANDELVFTVSPGTGAAATFANDGSGVITSITVTNQGNGYTTNVPVVTVNEDAGGNGAVLTASLVGSGANLIAHSGEGPKIPHTGWVLRKEGTGGRAGRVSYEVLVAGGISSDGSDDTILPDS